MFQSKITKEEIESKPILKFEGDIIVVDNLKNIQNAINELNNATILGFDTETKPSFRKGTKNKVALLQLSTNEKAWLFRLNKIGLPEELANVLANTNIIKVGVAIHDDILTLQKLRKFKPQSFIDLQKIAKNYNIEHLGLKPLAAIVLDAKISKSQQLSNWESQTLTDGQCVYAATDAWVTRRIYTKMIHTKDNTNKIETEQKKLEKIKN